jgi:hypothetical protein
MEVTMKIIITTLSLALLMWVEAASAQSRTYSLSVSVHSGLPKLSDDQVKDILDKASKMLQKNPSHPESGRDVKCDVTLTLKGPVRTFSHPPAVVDEHNIDAANKVDSDVDGVDVHVKVSEQIKFCRPGVVGNQAGCAFSPGHFRSMIVVHPALHIDPRRSDGVFLAKFPDHLLWAHEFGHLTGLPHRKGASESPEDEFALMTRCPLFTQFFGIPDARVQVNKEECNHMLEGPGRRSPGPFITPPSCRPLP